MPLDKPLPSLLLALYQLLRTYGFPGNVRELEAMVFDAVARHQGAILSLQSFKDAMSGKPQFEEIDMQPGNTSLDFTACFAEQLPALDQAEEVLVDEALRRADGNQGVAALLLGISRQALDERLARRRNADARPLG